MAIELSRLREAAKRPRRVIVETASDASARGFRSVFLCHAHQDRDLAEGLLVELEADGFEGYVDWKDAAMPAITSRQTANALKGKIAAADFFFFLMTPNSLKSRWCPWELGIADGTKDFASILVISTRDGKSTYGSEYLDIYKRIDFSASDHLAAWVPGATKGTLLSSLLAAKKAMPK